MIIPRWSLRKDRRPSWRPMWILTHGGHLAGAFAEWNDAVIYWNACIKYGWSYAGKRRRRVYR
jgi:hypothetical protein